MSTGLVAKDALAKDKPNERFQVSQADIDATKSIRKLAKESSDSRLALVDDSALHANSERVGIVEYLRSIWNYRHFTILHARYRSMADTDDMFLGKAWTVLEPILRIAMYGILFGLILNTSRGIENFIGFLIIGITFFSMISRGLGGGSGLLQRSRSMIGTFNFPRASIVVGEQSKAFFASLVPGVLGVLAALLFQWGTPLSWTIVSVVPLFVLINIFSFGLMLISARITAFLPDARKLIQFISRAWFYISGVFFSVERYASVPELQTAMMANPAYQFLEAIRGGVLYNDFPDLNTWASLASWSFGTLIVGFIFFWRAENRYVHVR